MYEFMNNFYEMFSNEDAFCTATKEQINQLKNLWGNNIYKITELYEKYQPNNIPMLESYVKLLGIDSIIDENTIVEPGKYLSQFGVLVFALTVGGDLLCIDTNKHHDGDACVLIVDSNFCSYNEIHDCIEIGIVPDDFIIDYSQGNIIKLNYDNICKYIHKVEDSFILFMSKLSRNEYDDIEDFL